MIGAAPFLLALGIGAAAVPVAELDIPFFLENPKIHEETLRRCHDDYALSLTPECANAEAAGSRRLGRPLPPLAGNKKPPATIVPAPLPPKATKGKDRAA